MRLVEDLLRAEYVEIRPALQRSLTAVEIEVAHLLLPTKLDLQPHEQVLVRGRVKDCESAVDALRRRQEGGRFDTDDPTKYSLLALPDLVGIRVLTFPPSRLDAALEVISGRIQGWTADHVYGRDHTLDSPPVAWKFHGLWLPDDDFHSEIQIASLLLGLFWEVEHSAIYKPSPRLRGVAESMSMRARTDAVTTALREFEEEFSRVVEADLDLP